MKIAIVCVLLSAVCLSQALLFDDLFGPPPTHCTTDADCSDGCCLYDGFRHTCSHRTISYLQRCHLNGHEYSSCGCADGYHCESLDHLSLAIESSNIPPGYGVCEHGVGNRTTTKAPLVAVEQG
ncbi:uncharacterized protein LOC117334061 [Pecten maximus]|uniref:uncharacterized protein LOC117334061 n=1 Tax=Pecten maximus TaxID=6579 RepID=UPI001458CB91|nr:uncharacterized protein LOC117334061 [Pecten maximus]